MRHTFDNTRGLPSYAASSLAAIGAAVTAAPPRKRLSAKALDLLSPAAGPWADAARLLGKQAARFFRPVLKGQTQQWAPGYQRGPRVARQLVGRLYQQAPFCQRRLLPGTDAAVAIALDGSGSMWEYAGEPETHPGQQWPAYYPSAWEDTRMGQAKLLGQALTYGLTNAGAKVACFTQRKAHPHNSAQMSRMKSSNNDCPVFAESLDAADWNVLNGTHSCTEAVLLKSFDAPYSPHDFAYYTAGANTDSAAHSVAAYAALLNQPARTKILFVLADGGLGGGDGVGSSYAALCEQGLRDGVAVILLSMADPAAAHSVPASHKTFYHLVRAEDTANATAEAAKLLAKALAFGRQKARS